MTSTILALTFALASSTPGSGLSRPAVRPDPARTIAPFAAGSDAGPQDPAPAAQAADEQAIRARIQDYYASLQREDPQAVLAAWSATAERKPGLGDLQALFATGDDEYAIEIRRLVVKGSEATARIVVRRERIVAANRARFPSTTIVDETWARDGDTWKLAGERSATDAFADELLATPADGRERLLADNPDLVNPALRRAVTFRGQLMAIQQQYARAMEPFDLALVVARKSHDREGEVEGLQNVANAFYYLRDYEKSIATYSEELALARAGAIEVLEASATMGLATVAYVRGEYGPALTRYREALAIYERRNEASAIGRTLVSIGNVQYLQGDHDDAAATYHRGLDFLVKDADVTGASLARSGLGRVYAAKGDLGAALDVYGQVLSDARARRNPGEEAPALESIGELHFRLRNTDEARAAFTDARKLVEEAGNWDGAGRLLADIGLTELVAGRFDAAVTAYTDSRLRYEKAKHQDGVARAWVGLGFAQTAREKYDDGIAAYRTAIEIFGTLDRQEDAARAWLGLSMAQSGRGDTDAALSSATRVRSIADAIVNEDLRWRGATRQGEALRKLAKLDDAQRAFEEAIATIQRIAVDLATSSDARAQLDDSGSAYAGLAMTLAAKGDAAAALVMAEARRAHQRRMILAPFERDIARDEPAEDRDAERQVDHDIVSVRAQLRAERNSPHPDTARFDRLRQQLASLLIARNTQQAALYGRLPDLQLWRGVRPVSTADDLSAVLVDPRVALLEYVVSEDEVLVLSAVRGETGIDASATIVPVKRRALADVIASALEPVSLRDAAQWGKRAGKLSEFLIAPAAAALAGRDRCLIVPDDLLWKVPFEALPVLDASRMRVSYVSSLAAAAIRRAAAADAAPPTIFGDIAGPEIAAPVRAQLALTRPGWTPPDAALQAATARRTASIYGDAARVVTGTEATEPAARRLLEEADVVEFAAPLAMSGPSPLLSAALLAGAEESREANGRLELREWFGLRARARTLVLSDGSAFGATGMGDAIEALDWAAAAMGVSSLLVTRWPADTFSTDDLIRAVHERLAHGDAAADALAAAIARARKANAAPAAWSGLRLLGR